jgi:hypothetical protein
MSRIVRMFYTCENRSHIGLAITSAQVRKQLAEEEAAASSLGEIAVHDVSPSTFIHTGLELEEYQ